MGKLRWALYGLAWISVIQASCESGDPTAKPCTSPVEDSLLLSEAGLYCDPTNTELALEVRPYSPRFELWADDADKRRWIVLPETTQINTSDMDQWQLPVGTKIWKEFSKNGVRVETRLMKRTSEDLNGWIFKTFAWNAEQTDAVDTQGVLVKNALGTGHDIPSQGDCVDCHRKQPSSVLGFGAIQLDQRSDDAGGIDLHTLIQEGLLTDNPSGEAPFFPLPGNEETANAFGYLHSNCGSCHNQYNPVLGNGIHLKLEVERLATPLDTLIYQTTVDVPSVAGDDRVEPGNPGASNLMVRMNTRPGGMPPVASNDVDHDGLALVTAWICSLAECL